MEEKEVSVVSIWSSSGHCDHADAPKYIKKLKITDGSISLKKQVPEDCCEIALGEAPGQIVDFWEVRSKKENYQKLLEWARFELNDARPKRGIPVGTSFTIRVTYVDGTHETRLFHGDCQSNHLDHFAYLVRELIPEGFDHPDELDVHDFANLDGAKLDELIGILKERPKIDHSRTPRWVGDIGYLMCPDFEYVKHVENIRAKEIHIEHFDVDDVRAYLTYYWRGEHFCDGFMISEIESGVVVKVLKRLSELYKERRKDCASKDAETDGL